jgi:hypothetical protein
MQGGYGMKYYEISYYRTRNWIDKRYACSELGSSAAIIKSRVKNPLNVEEITEAEYKEYSAKRKAIEAARKQRHADLFLQ